MSINLLTQAIEGKWAILPNSLEAISEIIQDHDKIFSRKLFHGGEDSIQSVIGTMGKRVEGTRFVRRVGSVGILTIDGPIIPRISSSFSGPVASLEAYAADLDVLEADDTIETIVGSFDSPGGYVTGVAEFAERVRNSSKRTVGFVYGYAASAMYWIASSFDELHGSRTSEVGSIGTVALFEDRTAQMEKAGIKRLEIVSNLSPNKRLGVDTPEGKKEVVKILDQITTEFVADVATGRGVTSDIVLEKFGQGKMFIASEAKELGMIDGITTLDSLVKDLNTKQKQTEGFMPGAKESNDTVATTAEEFKATNPSAHEEIYQAGMQAGISAEQERLKNIEALKEHYPEASAFIDSKKFNGDLDDAKMSLEIIKAKDVIMKTAATTIVTEGSQLAEDSSEIAAVESSASTDEQGEEDDALIAAAIGAAGDEHKKLYGKEMETK